MNVRPAFSIVLLAALTVAVGCSGGREVADVSPETLPDPKPVVGTTDGLDRETLRDNLEFGYLPELELLTVHFEYDSYNLTPEALDILTTNSEALARRPSVVIRIEGHCDERGTEEYNMALGYKRAQTVREYLVQYGIDPSNVSIISFGESRPVDPAHHEGAWGRNRRADFVVMSQ